jgi:hypothetical protein
MNLTERLKSLSKVLEIDCSISEIFPYAGNRVLSLGKFVLLLVPLSNVAFRRSRSGGLRPPRWPSCQSLVQVL